MTPEQAVGGSIILTILVLILSAVCTIVPLVVAVGGVVWFIRRSSQQSAEARQASQSWVETRGIVVTSRVEVVGGEDTTTIPRVVYQYEINGQAYQNDHLMAGDQFMISSKRGSPYDIVDRYAAGSEVTVYYNPLSPAQSALER